MAQLKAVVADDPVAFRKRQVKALKAHYKACFDSYEKWADSGYQYPPPATPPFPDICRGMKCGAKTRSGHPCKNDGTSYSNGRCKFHGGASTGPVTREGKSTSAANGFKRKSENATS